MSTPDERKDTVEPWGDEQAMAEGHARRVSGMFGSIARWYDPLNHILSGGLDRRWRACLAAAVLPSVSDSGATPGTNPDTESRRPPRVLDLAAGTLDVALALRRRCPDARIPAFDFCPPMLAHGVRKLKKEDKAFVWPVAADARALPLSDACLDGITIAFGIRNIVPRSAAFAEMARVLAPGGRACVLEFGGGAGKLWFGLYRLYLKRILPLLGRLSGNADAYRYLADTILAFPDADALSEEMREAGFARVYHLAFCSGIVLLHVAEKARI